MVIRMALDATLPIAEHELSAAFDHRMQRFAAHQFLEALHLRLFHADVVKIPGEPAVAEPRVVDEHIARRVRRIRTVFEIVDAAVQQQHALAVIRLGVKYDGGECIVLIVENQRAVRRAIERFGQRPRRQIGIEHHQRQPRGVDEQHHHDHGAHDLAAPRRDRADQKADARQQQRRSQIRERRHASDRPCVRATACTARDAASARAKYRRARADSTPATG